MKNQKSPFEITNQMIDYVAEIAELVTRLILKYGPAILEKHQPKDLESDQNEVSLDVESEKFEIAA